MDPIKLIRDFPLFKLRRLTRANNAAMCDGTISSLERVPPIGKYIFLLLKLPDAVYGDVVASDPSTGHIELQLQDDKQLVEGNEYRLFPGYHDAYTISMVLDEELIWTRKLFVPDEAVEIPATDGFQGITPTGNRSGHLARFYPVIDGKVASPMQGIVPGGWDHEHCELCQTTISPYEIREGFVSDLGHWVCPECFAKHIFRRDLSFIG